MMILIKEHSNAWQIQIIRTHFFGYALNSIQDLLNTLFVAGTPSERIWVDLVYILSITTWQCQPWNIPGRED
jgi:hypothetical protein